MRHNVPFVGERKVVRADDEQSRAKRLNNRVIDDVVGDGVADSSWEDVVSPDWVDPTLPVSMKAKSTSPAKPSASVSMPSGPKPKVPIRAGAGTNSAPVKTPAKKTSSSASSSITFSDVAGLDWTPINNGRGLRVNIYGSIDNNLRKEWARLMEGTAESGINQFEFNLSEAPALSLTGLGMLLLFKERKGSARDDITLCNCNKEVAQLLEWSGMNKYFVIKTTQIAGAM